MIKSYQKHSVTFLYTYFEFFTFLWTCKSLYVEIYKVQLSTPPQGSFFFFEKRSEPKETRRPRYSLNISCIAYNAVRIKSRKKVLNKELVI